MSLVQKLGVGIILAGGFMLGGPSSNAIAQEVRVPRIERREEIVLDFKKRLEYMVVAVEKEKEKVDALKVIYERGFSEKNKQKAAKLIDDCKNRALYLKNRAIEIQGFAYCFAPTTENPSDLDEKIKKAYDEAMVDLDTVERIALLPKTPENVSLLSDLINHHIAHEKETFSTLVGLIERSAYGIHISDKKIFFGENERWTTKKYSEEYDKLCGLVKRVNGKVRKIRRVVVEDLEGITEEGRTRLSASQEGKLTFFDFAKNKKSVVTSWRKIKSHPEGDFYFMIDPKVTLHIKKYENEKEFTERIFEYPYEGVHELKDADLFVNPSAYYKNASSRFLSRIKEGKIYFVIPTNNQKGWAKFKVLKINTDVKDGFLDFEWEYNTFTEEQLEEKVAFVSNRDGDNEIYTMSLDGGRLRKITNNDVNDTSPLFSPNREQIAYLSGERIHIFDIKEGKDYALSEIKNSFTWLDNKRLIVTKLMPAMNDDIYMISKKDKGGYMIWFDGGFKTIDDYPVCWGGRFVGFSAISRKRRGFVMLDINGKVPPKYIPAPKNLHLPFANTITGPVYSASGNPMMYSLRGGLTNNEPCCPLPGPIRGKPTVSPNGINISFRTKDGNLYVFDSERAHDRCTSARERGELEKMLEKIKKGEVFQLPCKKVTSDPCWSRDGKKIAYSSNIDGDNEIYVIEVTANHRLPPLPSDYDNEKFKRFGIPERYLKFKFSNPRKLTNNKSEDIMPNF